MIISFNGTDGVGKTTLINEVINKTSRKFVVINKLDIDVFDKPPKLVHKWWFHETSCEYFCEVMYSKLKELYLSLKPTENYIMDKGISTYDARIWATLILKGASRDEASRLLKKHKASFIFREDARIHILSDNCKYEAIKIYDNSYSLEQQELYKKYILLQKEYFEILEKQNYFTFSTVTSNFFNYFNLYFNSKKEIKTSLSLFNANTIAGKVAHDIYLHTKKFFHNDLRMFCVHGSFERGNFIEGWSDIDIIISVKNINYYDVKRFYYNFPKTNIKVGTTIYDEKEIVNLNVDSKTLFVLFCVNHGRIVPQYLKSKKTIPSISMSDIRNKNLFVLPEIAHSLRCLLFREPMTKANIKKIVKTMNQLMKIILINTLNIFSTSYESVCFNFSYSFGIECLDILKCIKNLSLNKKIIIDYAYLVLNIYRKVIVEKVRE